MSKPILERCFSFREWDAKYVHVRNVDRSDFGYGAQILYTNTDSGITYRPIFRFKENAMVAKPGLEPKNGKFSQNEDGKWIPREERPTWDPNQEGQWLVTLSMPAGSRVTYSMDKVALQICRLMCDELKIPKKKVTVKSRVKNIGDFGAVSLVQFRVMKRAIMYDGDDTQSGKLVHSFSDYPLDPRDTVPQFSIQPAYPTLTEDKNHKGNWIFNLTWVLRFACVGPPKEEKPPKTEEEKDAEALELFADVIGSDDSESEAMEEAEDSVELTPENSAKRPGENPFEHQEPRHKKAKTAAH